MALDPGSSRTWTGSPESSGRDSPIPRQWRNQLGVEEIIPTNDKAYKRYAAAVEKVLSGFETALEEWADYISFLNRILKALQARPSANATIPAKAILSKRLSQCLNPSLPSGVHQKALEVYNYVFETIGNDGLSRDLPLYLPGLAPTLSFASLSVRSPFLELVEKHFVKLDARSLRPAMRSIILALLPGLEDETSEDFDRTLKLVDSFKKAIRPSDSKELTSCHSLGDDFFWQCFFMASITSQSRRAGALAYLVRHLPSLGNSSGATGTDENGQHLATMVTSPEPGLLIRCFASGLADDQVLIQRGFLDLLVSVLPLNSTVLQTRVKPWDLELLLKSAVNVVIRRDMSLNRRLWAWLLGPEPAAPELEHSHEVNSTPSEQHAYLSTRTQYFEEHGLAALTRALLDMIMDAESTSVSERAKPYRVCLSLMDRWEIGGLVVPEIFLPVVESVERFKQKASSPAEFKEVLRSASVFFDGIESGLIYSELVALVAQAIGPSNLDTKQRSDKLSLVSFIVANFNVREEEMVTIHAPLTCLAALYMLQKSPTTQAKAKVEAISIELVNEVLSIVLSLLELIPERAFPASSSETTSIEASVSSVSNLGLLKKIRDFYVNEQGNLEASSPPFTPLEAGQLVLQRAAQNVYDDDNLSGIPADVSLRVRVLLQALIKVPRCYQFEERQLLSFIRQELAGEKVLAFTGFSSMLNLVTQMYYSERIKPAQLSEFVLPLVHRAWAFLSLSEPKYHVETVRCLWHLQTALTVKGRDIEAALSTLMVRQKGGDNADVARKFGVLWSHTIQDSQPERRNSKSVGLLELRPRLAGADCYEVMLTQPLFLVLDALMDERTNLYMTVKSWLNSMVGLDRLVLLFMSKISSLPFLQSTRDATSSDELDTTWRQLSETDDLDLCLYYLRTLHNVLTCTGEMSWRVMSLRHIAFNGETISIITVGQGSEPTLQDLLLRILIRCVAAKYEMQNSELVDRACQLQRYALNLLRQLLVASEASRLAHFHSEDILIDCLEKSITGPDPFTQGLLLDNVFSALSLQASAVERPVSSTSEKFHSSTTDLTRSARLSLASAADNQSPQSSLPPKLLNCILAGLGAKGTQSVLDSWVRFLGACLPLYGGSIFQNVIPLVETLSRQIGITFWNLRATFSPGKDSPKTQAAASEMTLIYLLNGLEQVLARAHDQLLADEARAHTAKSPDQPQSLFGSMVSGVFQSDAPQGRSATANDRLTVHLAFQDAVRICYKIWSWGQGDDSNASEASSVLSFTYTSLRMRNRARRLLEHLFTAEMLECLETVVGIWNQATSRAERSQVFNFLAALEASRPRQTIPSLFNSILSRTNPSALEPSLKSTMTISLEDTDLGLFLVKYTQSLDDDAMDEIWRDCIIFLKDILANPLPHRQTLPSLMEFAALLGAKVDNTTFGEQRKMRRELGDVFSRLLAGLFITRPIVFAEAVSSNGATDKAAAKNDSTTAKANADERHVVAILASVIPALSKVLPEPDRVLSAAGTISVNVIGPTLRSKIFPDSISRHTLELLRELSKIPNNQKSWKKDVGDAFNDSRFFSMDLSLVEDDWLPLLRQWIAADKDKLPEIVSRIAAPTTAGIVFGVGATSARLEADRKTQLNLRRIATLVLAGAEDAFVTDLPIIFDKLVELLSATNTSSPSSATRADVYMVVRALVLRTSPVPLAMLWPVVNAEMHAAISSVVAPDSSAASETYSNAGVLQACKLLDLLICVAPDDFQLHEWLFVTDSIDAVHRSSWSKPIALADEISEDLGSVAATATTHHLPHAHDHDAVYVAATMSTMTTTTTTTTDGGGMAAQRKRRHVLLGPDGISDDVSLERRDELVAKVLRPFFGQLSIFAFESMYAMGAPDVAGCVQGLLRDLFDNRTMVKAL